MQKIVACLNVLPLSAPHCNDTFLLSLCFHGYPVIVFERHQAFAPFLFIPARSAWAIADLVLYCSADQALQFVSSCLPYMDMNVFPPL
jgi:hypothetical protein